MTTKRDSKRKQDEAKAAKRLNPDKGAIADLQPSAKSKDVKGGGPREIWQTSHTRDMPD